MKEYGNLNFILNQIFKTKDYKKCAVSLIIDIIFFKDKVEVSWFKQCKTYYMACSAQCNGRVSKTPTLFEGLWPLTKCCGQVMDALDSQLRSWQI